MIRRSVLPFGAFLLALLAVFSAILLLGRVDVETVVGTPGTADLSAVDFNKKTAETASLAYIPRQFLSPGQVPLPQTSANAAFGSYEITLTLPDDKEYLLGFNSIPYATRVYINGQLTDEIGKVASSKEAYRPQRAYCHYIVQPLNGHVDVLLHYANFYDDLGRAPALHIGLPNQMINRQVHADFTRFTLMAVYLAAFILYFGIYLFRRHGNETLFFALTCLVLAVRESFVGEQFLSSLLSNIPWDVIFILQYLAIGVLVILLFSFIISLFPFVLPRQSTGAFYIMCGLFLLVSIFSRTYMPRLQLFGFLGIGTFIMIFITVQILRHIKALPPDKILSAAGILLLFLAFFNDMFHLLHIVFGPVGRRALLSPAMIVYIFIQMVALFLQFMRTERELSEIREKQAALASQNETLQLVDRQRIQFLSNVSHELKTPMTVVSNYAQLSRLHEQRKQSSDDYIVNKMLLVTSEVERMALMVDQILDISRIEEGRLHYEFAPSDVGAIVQSTIGVYYPVLNKNRNTLLVEIEPGLPLVFADAGRISQVLVNLITNAVKFTSRGTITVSAACTGNTVSITVRDTGVGMTQEQCDRLFERYYTREGVNGKGPGTGLGLFISQEIIRNHGGVIEVTSILNQGTSVTFQLPAHPKEESDESSRHPAG